MSDAAFLQAYFTAVLNPERNVPMEHLDTMRLAVKAWAAKTLKEADGGEPLAEKRDNPAPAAPQGQTVQHQQVAQSVEARRVGPPRGSGCARRTKGNDPAAVSNVRPTQPGSSSRSQVQGNQFLASASGEWTFEHSRLAKFETYQSTLGRLYYWRDALSEAPFLDAATETLEHLSQATVQTLLEATKQFLHRTHPLVDDSEFAAQSRRRTWCVPESSLEAYYRFMEAKVRHVLDLESVYKDNNVGNLASNKRRKSEVTAKTEGAETEATSLIVLKHHLLGLTWPDHETLEAKLRLLDYNCNRAYASKIVGKATLWNGKR